MPIVRNSPTRCENRHVQFEEAAAFLATSRYHDLLIVAIDLLIVAIDLLLLPHSTDAVAKSLAMAMNSISFVSSMLKRRRRNSFISFLIITMPVAEHASNLSNAYGGNNVPVPFTAFSQNSTNIVQGTHSTQVGGQRRRRKTKAGRRKSKTTRRRKPTYFW